MSIIKEKRALIIVSSFPSFGPITLKKLFNYFSSWSNILTANFNDLKEIGLKDSTIFKFFDHRKSSLLEKIFKIIELENIKVIDKNDDNYPKLLKEIPSAPYLLYLKGEVLFNKKFNLTVIGSRQTDYYSLKVTKELINTLNQKIIIISGLAKGIDTMAHINALRSNKKTIAVLGSGIDKASIYPKENKYLAEKIISEGSSLISEFPPLTLPLKSNFPQRNRILAGLSLATLVIAAREKSGALITANLALDFNRDVLTIPANISSPYSQGSNNLLKSGATVILNSLDIEEVLNINN